MALFISLLNTILIIAVLIKLDSITSPVEENEELKEEISQKLGSIIEQVKRTI